MDKTPGQILYGNDAFWKTLHKDTRAVCEKDAARLIAYIRPQIECEARTVAVEEALNEIARNEGENILTVMRDVRALASAPAGMAVVPLDLWQKLISAVRFVANNDVMNPEYLKELANKAVNFSAARPTK